MTSGPEIALISGGFTAVVGVAGFGAAIWTNHRTIRAASDAMMWDKRAEVYVDAIAAVHYRQTRREHDMRTWSLQPEDARREEAYLAVYAEPDWYQLEGRLMAFASHTVIAAMQASSTAHMRASSATRSLLDDDARNRAETARKAADRTDDTLIERIRTELQGGGPPIGDWQKFPPD